MSELNEADALIRKLSDLERGIDKLSAQIEAVSATLQGNAKAREGQLLHYLDVRPDRFLERYYEHMPHHSYYEALHGGLDSVRGGPAKLGLSSGLCRQLHFATDEFRYWMRALGIAPVMHRKYWEYFYICQVLYDQDMLAPGKKGLVFAVGQEALPALFATFGCKVLASDQDEAKAIEDGWAATGQHSAQIEALVRDDICSRDTFLSSVRYEAIDMNAIPAKLSGGFDFCWSSCAFEHLGSLDHGLEFVERSMDTLVPGGVAVHTTELNLTSNDETLESPGLSIFRRRDMEELASRLRASGHDVLPFDWSAGPGFAETVVDLPPYRGSPHLKLQIARYDWTSVGIIVRKKT